MRWLMAIFIGSAVLASVMMLVGVLTWFSNTILIWYFVAVAAGALVVGFLSIGMLLWKSVAPGGGPDDGRVQRLEGSVGGLQQDVGRVEGSLRGLEGQLNLKFGEVAVAMGVVRNALEGTSIRLERVEGVLQGFDRQINLEFGKVAVAVGALRNMFEAISIRLGQPPVSSSLTNELDRRFNEVETLLKDEVIPRLPKRELPPPPPPPPPPDLFQGVQRRIEDWYSSELKEGGLMLSVFYLGLVEAARLQTAVQSAAAPKLNTRRLAQRLVELCEVGPNHEVQAYRLRRRNVHSKEDIATLEANFHKAFQSPLSVDRKPIVEIKQDIIRQHERQIVYWAWSNLVDPLLEKVDELLEPTSDDEDLIAAYTAMKALSLYCQEYASGYVAAFR